MARKTKSTVEPLAPEVENPKKEKIVPSHTVKKMPALELPKVKEIKKETERKLFFLGIVKTLIENGVEHMAPRHYVIVAGICFPRDTQQVVEGDDGHLQLSHRMPGQLVPLYKEELERIIEALKHRVVSWTNPAKKVGQNRIWSIQDPKYRPQAGDVPLAKYLYCIPAETREGMMRKVPETLDKTGLGWPE